MTALALAFWLPLAIDCWFITDWARFLSGQAPVITRLVTDRPLTDDGCLAVLAFDEQQLRAWCTFIGPRRCVIQPE